MQKVCKRLIIVLLVLISIKAGAVQIWVSPNGSDANAGSKDKPKATLSSALRQARELRRLNDPSVKEGVFIIVRGGTYTLTEPVFIRPEDSGTPESPTIIQSSPNEKPILSGGVKVSGWRKASAITGLPVRSAGKVWVTDAPLLGDDLLNFRQLWVNDNKAVRARDENGDSMNRILSWNKADQSCWIPKPKTGDLSQVKGMEMVIHQWWAIANLRVKGYTVQGDSVKLTFHQPESRIQSEHPWPAPWLSKKTGNSAFFLTNAIQFLDQPGEWYLDTKNRKLYYCPKASENMGSAEVIAPALETLLKMEGTIDRPVSYVFIKGLSFQHSTWLRPSKQGHVPLQGGMYLLDAYKLKVPGTPEKKGLENQGWIGRPASAVEVSYAHHTGFELCSFRHLASTGLDYKKGTHDSEIKGNLFKDIGGTGIQIGHYSDESFETHLPYNPSDLREVCTNEHIASNLITDVTNEDWGCLGISAGYVKGITIEHNEINNVSYSGISVGWGWTKAANVMSNNRILYNKIHHYAQHMYDVAAIYTLSSQPGSIIEGNYVDSIYKAPYVHDPNHWFYLYTDEGSSHITVKNNWVPAEKFLQNANGPGNVWENNSPQVDERIKTGAGLQQEYQELLKEKTPAKATPINQYVKPNVSASTIPSVIEITGKAGTVLNPAQLTNIMTKFQIPQSSVYQWNNHLVIYGSITDSVKLLKELRAAYAGNQVKIYIQPFYNFNRSKCNNQEVVTEWDNILLTANLVSNTRLQNEYMDYHATQFEKWPEVSNGFCNANFQQLLVYRNGRQLMLVISIPKGASLDELNPKTTENNPRVDQWNGLMKKYQEGIAGTKPGEVWVFLKPVNDKLLN